VPLASLSLPFWLRLLRTGLRSQSFLVARLFPVLPPTTPVSVVITQRQLEWLDHLRHQGAISRSAVLRVVLDRVIQQEQFQAAIARPTDAR
jgi:hypothetical protein